MMRSFLFYSFFLLALIEGKAQEKKTPDLSQLHIGIGYLPVLQFSPDNIEYRSDQMARLTLGINYLKGYINANLQYSSLVSHGQVPQCQMFDNSMSYLYYLHVTKGIYFFSGGQVGLNIIYFKNLDTDNDRRSETEVSAGLQLGLEMRVIPKLGLSGSYKLQRIFATPRNDLSMIDIGVVYYFNSNETLKKWLE